MPSVYDSLQESVEALVPALSERQLGAVECLFSSRGIDPWSYVGTTRILEEVVPIIERRAAGSSDVATARRFSEENGLKLKKLVAGPLTQRKEISE